MDNPRGTIESLRRDERGVHAIVGVDAAAACPRCAAGRGCGAGILVGSGARRHVEAVVRPGLELQEGDLVEIELAPDDLLRAALIVYGLPLAGALLGVAIAYALGAKDIAAVTAALAGLVAGLLLGRSRLRQKRCLSRFVPRISKPLAGTSTAGH